MRKLSLTEKEKNLLDGVSKRITGIKVVHGVYYSTKMTTQKIERSFYSTNLVDLHKEVGDWLQELTRKYPESGNDFPFDVDYSYPQVAIDVDRYETKAELLKRIRAYVRKGTVAQRDKESKVRNLRKQAAKLGLSLVEKPDPRARK